jgi:hydrogenase small subunit
VKLTRRDFIEYCAKAAAVLGLESALEPMSKALASTSGPPIIWLKGASCTGCTVSLANRISSSAPVDVADLLIHTVDLVYHPTLMAAAGDLAVQTLRSAEAGSFILAVEGGIPTQYGGRTCTLWTQNGADVTALSAVQELAPKARYVLSIGTCASFGGVAAAAPNPTSIVSVSTASGRSTINVPGCPPHPDWIVWTIAQLLGGTVPTLDSHRRPTALYGATVHSNCSRRRSSWATSLSQTGLCNGNLGCKGRRTYADCSTRQWNNGMNWCVGTVGAGGNGADSLCLGCTESGFPDKFEPIFSTMSALPLDHESVSPPRTSCTACHSGRPD